MNIVAQLRKLGCNDAMIAKATVDGKPLSEVKDAPKRSDGWPGFASKWEAIFAMELEDKKRSGEIIEWHYEPITFRLSDSSVVEGKKVRAITYTPDFVLWLPGMKMQCVEIKGFRNNNAINRFKVAKDKFRKIEFVMLKRTKGEWERLPY